jgi:hypothetical protein
VLLVSPQEARILAALRVRGSRGVTRVDFQLPDVIDGHAPILNFPARIKNLRDEGHVIVDEGRRHKCKVYRLLRDAQDAPLPPPRPTEATAEEGQLFGLPATNAIYHGDEAA